MANLTSIRKALYFSSKIQFLRPGGSQKHSKAITYYNSNDFFLLFWVGLTVNWGQFFKILLLTDKFFVQFTLKCFFRIFFCQKIQKTGLSLLLILIFSIMFFGKAYLQKRTKKSMSIITTSIPTLSLSNLLD